MGAWSLTKGRQRHKFSRSINKLLKSFRMNETTENNNYAEIPLACLISDIHHNGRLCLFCSYAQRFALKGSCTLLTFKIRVTNLM